MINCVLNCNLFNDLSRWRKGCETVNELYRDYYLLIITLNFFYAINIVSVHTRSKKNYNYLHLENKNKSITLITKIEQYIIDTVKRMRTEQKMSQATLGFCSNLSKSFIRDVENPKKDSKYNLNHINEFAKVFNCSPKDFLPEEFFEENRDAANSSDSTSSTSSSPHTP